MLCGGIQHSASQLPEGPDTDVLPFHGSCTWKNGGDSIEMECPQSWATTHVSEWSCMCTNEGRFIQPY